MFLLSVYSIFSHKKGQYHPSKVSATFWTVAVPAVVPFWNKAKVSVWELCLDALPYNELAHSHKAQAKEHLHRCVLATKPRAGSGPAAGTPTVT
eukprot:2790423-Amphidinium_carterae.1